MISSRRVMKNVLVGTVGHVCTMFLGFVIQRCFLHYLGLEILGVNGVITDILGLLSLAELGVGNAIVYRLYKPIVEQDTETIASMMQLYKKVYRLIGCVIFLVGNVMAIFLPHFMKDLSVNVELVYGAYYVQLLTTVSSYFMAYKSSLLFADQKQYIVKWVESVSNFVFCILRIVTLILFKDYILYLVLMLIQMLVKNSIIAIYYDKEYAFLKKSQPKKYTDVKGFMKDTKNVLYSKIVNYVYNSTDNLVISIMIGVVNVGSLSTYKLVTKSVNSLFYSMTDSIKATIGNFVNYKTKEESFSLLKKYVFATYMITSIACIGVYICIDSFITIAYGAQYLMPGYIKLLLVLDIYLLALYRPLTDFIIALGMFEQEKKNNICGACINLVCSIVFAKYIGVAGVLIGTCIAQVFFLVSKSCVLGNNYFEAKQKIVELLWMYLKYTGVVVIEVIITMGIASGCEKIQNNLCEFLVLGLVALAISGVFHLLFFQKTDEFQYFKAKADQLLSGKGEKQE